jgi:hypothetical protein
MTHSLDNTTSTAAVVDANAVADHNVIAKAKLKKRRAPATSSSTSRKRKTRKTTASRSANLLLMRADSRTTFNDENGNSVPLKTAAIVNPKKVTITDGRDINFSYEHISSDRPMTVTELSEKGSPIKGITPGRTTMYRAEHSSMLSIFTNSSALQVNADGTPLKEIQNTFEQSSAYKAVRNKDQDSYMQTVRIDAEQLKKVRQEIEEKGSSRNQNQVMKKEGQQIKKARATHYANSAEINTAGVSWEWLHKVAFRFIGRDGQTPENLGCGTAYANTDMLLIESALPQLTELIPDGFTLTVNSHYIKSTSILTKIDYIVSLDGNEYKACFNAQRQTKPLIAGYNYHHSFFKQLAEGKFPDEARLTPEEELAMQGNGPAISPR